MSMLLAAVMVLSMAGCGGGETNATAAATGGGGGATSGETSGGQTASGKTDLVVGITRGITSIWPGGENDQGTIIMNNQFYNRLLKKNYTTGELEPELAKSWTVSDDKLTYTFELRDDVYFHNGDKLTAEDVV